MRVLKGGLGRGVLIVVGVLLGCWGMPGGVRGAEVTLTEVEWHGTGCYRIEMPMGVVYFEKDNGVSGFKSFVDPEGNDWIASYLPPGPNGDFRGFPNSTGNFGHAGRDSGSTTVVVDGRTEGDYVILESTNGTFTFQYWFFPDRVAIKVLKSQGEYCFLLECVAGGAADAEDFFVTADGKQHIPTEEGEFDDFTPEWFYLGDPKSQFRMFLGKTPDDEAPNENHRQIRPSGEHNMDLYSFGRTGKEESYEVRGMSGNEHVCIIGFAPAERTHAQMSRMIEGMLAAPFAPEKTETAETAGKPAPTVWMIGDSTMSNKPLYPAQPERGWGQLLPMYFSDEVRVRNLARNGRSSKSFRDEGLWAPVLEELRPGDYVIIQFGHNDEKYLDAKRYTEPFGSYKEGLAQYASEVLERGGHPILATPIVRRKYVFYGEPEDTHMSYPAAVRELAREMQLPLLDLQARSAELVKILGPERAKELYLHMESDEFKRWPGRQDDTHLNAYGASRICDLATQEMRCAVPDLARWLK